MSKLASLLGGHGAMIAGVAGVGAVVVGAVIMVVGGYSADRKPPEPSSPISVAKPLAPLVDDAANTLKSAPEIAAEIAAEIAPVTALVSDPDAPENGTVDTDGIATLAPPSFDVVRIEADGSTLIAGRGLAGHSIEVQIDGAALTSVLVGPSGQFTTFLTIPPSDQPRLLTLLMTDLQSGADMASSETVILAPVAATIVAAIKAPVVQVTPEDPPENKPEMRPAVGATEVAIADPAILGTPPTQGEPGDGDAAQVETRAPVVPAAVSSAPIVPTAPVILLADEDGVRVLQAPAPSNIAPEVMSNVALDAITYTPTGAVEIAGRGTQSSFVRVYLDNVAITVSQIEMDGVWRTELPDIDSGLYTLRVDEVDPEGGVTSRVETPFKREAVAAVSLATPATSAQSPTAAPKSVSVKVLTVQPGSTLWAIARESYGDGAQYVRVFQANKDRIRNADLIYPGQVFTMPTQ